MRKKAAIVTQMPISTLPESTIAAIHKAGQELEAAGWEVEEVTPPELARVNEIWAHVLNADIQNLLPLLTPVMTESAIGLLRGLLRKFDPATKTITEIFTGAGTGSRLPGPRSSRTTRSSSGQPGRIRRSCMTRTWTLKAGSGRRSSDCSSSPRGTCWGYRRSPCQWALSMDCRPACRSTPSVGARTCASMSPVCSSRAWDESRPSIRCRSSKTGLATSPPTEAATCCPTGHRSSGRFRLHQG